MATASIFCASSREAAAASLPVLMLSSEADVADRIRGLTTGADDYVGKPYDPMYVVAGPAICSVAMGCADAKSTILVIDDSPTYRDRLARNPRRGRLSRAHGRERQVRLAMMADGQPNAVIVDGMMPDMDGPSLIRRVRLDAATPRHPLHPAHRVRGGLAQLRALEAGADAFVRKDDDTDIILARLAAVIRRAAIVLWSGSPA